MSEPPSLMLEGMSEAERKNSGIVSWDDYETASKKLNAYRTSGSIIPPIPAHTFEPLPTAVYVPSGGYGVVDQRSQYEKDLDSAKRQNLARMAIILAIVGVLFWVLNATIGQNIRGNTFYGATDSFRFYVNELRPADDFNIGMSPERTKEFQIREAKEFAETFGALFKPDTPYVRMFDDCKGKYDCTSVSLGAVQRLQRFANKPGSLLDDMCAVQSGELIRNSMSSYTGLLESKFAAKDQYSTNVCVSVNPAQVKAVAEPLNKRYKLAEAGFLILIPLAVFLLLIFIVPKAEYPKKES